MRIAQPLSSQYTQGLGVLNTDIFREHLSSLMNTVSWIEANELRSEGIAGWRSNNLLAKRNEVAKPQSWSTASVMLFIRQLEVLLQGLIRDQRLEQLGATYHHSLVVPDLSGGTWTRRADSESQPIFDHLPNSLKELVFQSLIDPHLRQDDSRLWSGILFGPPGTAKTSMVTDIAGALGWTLVALGISDFLAEGEDRLAHRAQLIFKQLTQLTDAVVFIDEVDELIRSRTAKDAHPSGRLITTAMLTLLQSVLEKKSTLLLVATNNLEGMDSAAQRRFDARILVLPPSFAEKRRIFREIQPPFEETTVQSIENVFDNQRELIERLTFGEWSAFLRTLQSVLPADKKSDDRAASDLLDQLSKDSIIDKDSWIGWKMERSYV